MIEQDRIWRPDKKYFDTKNWYPRQVRRVETFKAGVWIQYFEYISNRVEVCSIKSFTDWVLKFGAVLSETDLFEHYEIIPHQYEIVVADKPDQNILPVIMEWMDENVDCKWHLETHEKGKTPNHHASFSDLPTATLFRLRF
jgi:hypothetical protein